MKPVSRTDVIVRTSGNLGEAREFGIKATDVVHLAGILRDRLYSKKEEAVIREYSTNAWDAHAEIGNPNPFHVTLPTVYDPVLVIRDFGPGLSEESIYDVYVQFGRSTRRDSNTGIGQFGIGSKSAFAYADTFMLTSVHGGIKNSYAAYLDEDGSNKVRRVRGPEETDEPTGIEIRVPVKPADINTFIAAARKIFRYFEPRPIISGHELDFTDEEVAIQPTESRRLGHGRDWYIVNSTNMREEDVVPLAIMGCIAYPINLSEIPEVAADPQLMDLAYTGVRLYFGIGDLSISASRESLEYRSETRSAITRKLQRVRATILEQVQEDIDSRPTLSEALDFWAAAYTGSKNSKHRAYLAKYGEHTNLNWRGTPIRDYLFAPLNDSQDGGLKLITVEALIWGEGKRSNSKAKWRLIEDVKMVPLRSKEPHSLYFLVDDDQFWQAKAKWLALEYEKEHGKRPSIYLFKFGALVPEDDRARRWQEFLDKWGFQHMDVTIHKASDINYSDIKVTIERSERLADKSKTSRKVFRLLPSTRNHSTRSVHWEIADVDPSEGGFYVPLNKYMTELFPGKKTGYWNDRQLGADGADLTSIIASWNHHFGDDIAAEEIFGIKVKHLDRYIKETGWVNLRDYMREQVIKWNIKNRMFFERYDLNRRIHSNFSFRFAALLAEREELLIRGNHELIRFARRLVDENKWTHPAIQGHGDRVAWLRRFLSINPSDIIKRPFRTDLHAIRRGIYHRYPLLLSFRAFGVSTEEDPEGVDWALVYSSQMEDYLKGYRTSRRDSFEMEPEDMQPIIEYINMIDSRDPAGVEPIPPIPRPQPVVVLEAKPEGEEEEAEEPTPIEEEELENAEN